MKLMKSVDFTKTQKSRYLDISRTNEKLFFSKKEKINYTSVVTLIEKVVL